MAAAPMRLSTRLGLTHGALVALILVLLAATLQGLLRMLSLVTDIREHKLSSIDAEERVHRAAWNIDVTMRHGRARCAAGRSEEDARAALATAQSVLQERLAIGGVISERVRSLAQRYDALATEALDGKTCTFLTTEATDEKRGALDEELTDAWIDRLFELHADIEEKQDRARRIGVETAVFGFSVALLATVIALAIARSTARAVAEPVAVLAAAATRLGEGDFAPIPPVDGPREVEDLWRDLERARGRLRELDELKQSFLASVSHEMRSPLASLREALALLSDGTCGDLTPKQARVLVLARRACEREVRIVEALLDISRLRSGMPLKREAGCIIDDVIARAAEEERDVADERGVAIELEHDGHAPAMQIDAVLVERALANVLRNAVSVSKRGDAVRVTRSVHAANSSRSIAIEVQDSGPGIEESIRDSIFRPFTAATVPAAQRSAGIGLGLSFAREVARAHAGELSLVRSDSSGTTFRFDLPVTHEET